MFKLSKNRHEIEEITAKEAGDLLALVVSTLGSSESDDIEAASNACLTVQSFLAKVEAINEQLESDLSDANNRVIGLQRSNNEIMRQLNAQRMGMEKAEEELSNAAKFASHF